MFCVNAFWKCHILEISSFMLTPERWIANFEKTSANSVTQEMRAGLFTSVCYTVLICEVKIILEFPP